MNEISFSKYFKYILKENGFSNLREQTIGNELRVDLTATKDNQTYYFEFKIFKNRHTGRTAIPPI
jgi:Holliday junction resolvase